MNDMSLPSGSDESNVLAIPLLPILKGVWASILCTPQLLLGVFGACKVLIDSKQQSPSYDLISVISRVVEILRH